jgi:hypothetical protein
VRTGTTFASGWIGAVQNRPSRQTARRLNMKIIALTALVLAGFCGSLSGPVSENERFIQGSWRLAGEHTEDTGSSRAWFLEWKFSNGRFEQEGYPPIHQSGSYDVVSDEENTLRLKLRDQQGTFGREDRVIEIRLRKDAGEIDIDRSLGFKRLE